ncbi:hypothetical protein AHIS2_p056 [Acaryochloris phage A-HIS2]|nr:hypothetical protein AHIS2_p056 [Acaryochloris phage A-HIS2]
MITVTSDFYKLTGCVDQFEWGIKSGNEYVTIRTLEWENGKPVQHTSDYPKHLWQNA